MIERMYTYILHIYMYIDFTHIYTSGTKYISYLSGETE